MRSRVLLIDADSQRPSLHKAFGIPTAPGLHELLDTESEIVLEQYISETGIAGLQLLQSRHRARTPEPERPEILLSRRISELMRATRQRYDFILIDTPPLLQGADSRIWGQLADGVVLVIRAGSTDRQRATAAVSTLSKDGAVVLGTVLNDLHPSRIQCYEYCRS
jgi:capsular exopolysaccharide synthesis family protein